MAKKSLNVAMIGAQFMGKAHSNAWRRVGMFFDLPVQPVMKLMSEELPREEDGFELTDTVNALKSFGSRVRASWMANGDLDTVVIDLSDFAGKGHLCDTAETDRQERLWPTHDCLDGCTPVSYLLILPNRTHGPSVRGRYRGLPPSVHGSSTSRRSAPGRETIFACYSHKNEYWRQRLQVHMASLKNEAAIDCWDDTKIRPGSQWRAEIEEAIMRARAAVLLVSADFLASPFITSNELPRLLAMSKKRGTIILPVIVSPCRFLQTPDLSQFQAVNTPDRPLLKMSEEEQEEVFVRVTDTIAEGLKGKVPAV
ncbi:MAG TPA: toll/interleukin-1 receptor domain-containing protein [Candidatus Bathyarchaeia archaeon]|nr:toll/interleukin-1 receptor domain-containing protein [Candidatus Bathyarchaeia archaeon]